MDIVFQTKKDELKQVLSLIPAVYISGLEEVKTNGNARVEGFVKGIYNDTSFPSFKIDVNLTDASLKYPDLPETVSNINLVSKINFKGGENLDNYN